MHHECVPRRAAHSQSIALATECCLMTRIEPRCHRNAYFCRCWKVPTIVTKPLREISDNFLLDIKARTITLLKADILADIKERLGEAITATQEKELEAEIESELNARITMEEVAQMLMDAPRSH